MAIFNAGKEGYPLARIDGRQVLFTSMRLDRATIPEGLYCYDIRDSDRLDGSFTEVRPFVEGNHLGTILCREPFPLAEGGAYTPKNWGFCGGMSLEEFRQGQTGQTSA